ncbi:hypothetical protein E2C01_038307 [Portunus trituberculatus]|uniref:Uncharacterized protein n=1 Tax=Portunus trituberculatus TaxID=210409 RepID=A0A5B7FAI8_PORTR|nr:hypothetical protein [Portunus trituberculatus]
MEKHGSDAVRCGVSCQVGFIGSTIRAFKIRVDEHKGQSSRTDRRSHNPPHSAVRGHSEVRDVSLKTEHFKTIDDDILRCQNV